MIAVVFLFNSASCTKDVDKKLDPNQILEEMKNQKEVLEKHYKYIAMDANGNISKSDSRK